MGTDLDGMLPATFDGSLWEKTEPEQPLQKSMERIRSSALLRTTPASRCTVSIDENHAPEDAADDAW